MSIFKKEKKQGVEFETVKDKVKGYLLDKIKREKRSIKEFEQSSEEAKLEFLDKMQKLERPSEWVIENKKRFNQNLQMFKMLMRDLREDSNLELINITSKEIKWWEHMVEHNEEHIKKEEVESQSKKEKITKEYERVKADREKLLKYHVDVLEKAEIFLELLEVA